MPGDPIKLVRCAQETASIVNDHDHISVFITLFIYCKFGFMLLLLLLINMEISPSSDKKKSSVDSHPQCHMSNTVGIEMMWLPAKHHLFFSIH